LPARALGPQKLKNAAAIDRSKDVSDTHQTLKNTTHPLNNHIRAVLTDDNSTKT
jgi:hypothetical protein